MEKNNDNSEGDNRKWIEEDLFKLPCKELKKLARKSHINPNFKKADLVKALLNSISSVPVTMEVSELKENERDTRRMTRSRVSIFQPSNEVQHVVTEVKIIDTKKRSAIRENVLVDVNESRVNRKGKQKAESSINDSVLDVFKMVSIIETKSKPLVEITNKKTAARIGETNKSDGAKKNLDKKSRRSEPKMKSTLKMSNGTDVDSCTENSVDLKESVPESFHKNNSNSSESKKEDLSSQGINNVPDVNDVKGKRKGRKKKLEEQSDLSATVNITRETLHETEMSEVHSDQKEKPKVERKRRILKQKEEKICHNLEENTKNNTSGEFKVSDTTVCHTEPELGHQKKRRGKTSKSDVVDVSENKNTSGVLTMLDISKTNIQNNSSSLVEKLGDASMYKNRSSRNSNVTTEKCVVNNNSVDLFNDDMIDADHAEDLSNISGKRSINETAMPVAVPLRSSTFVLDSPDLGRNSSGSTKQFDKPSRSNTFTIDENDDKSSKLPKRTSLRFVADSALQHKPSPTVKSKKTEKSIGKRILSAFVKKNNTESVVKSEKSYLGSSVKKTITKATTTPAYLNKFGVARKAPNFKDIHQKLFENMESLGDNKKRKLARAQDLLLSPAPRCAVSRLSPRTSLEKKNKSLAVLTPVQLSAPPTVTKTPGTAKAATHMNRFRFAEKPLAVQTPGPSSAPPITAKTLSTAKTAPHAGSVCLAAAQG